MLIVKKIIMFLTKQPLLSSESVPEPWGTNNGLFAFGERRKCV